MRSFACLYFRIIVLFFCFFKFVLLSFCFFLSCLFSFLPAWLSSERFPHSSASLSLLCLPPPPPPVTHQVWLFIVIAIVMVRSGAWLIDWFNSLVWWFNLSVLFFAPRYLQYFAVFFSLLCTFSEVKGIWRLREEGMKRATACARMRCCEAFNDADSGNEQRSCVC